MKPIIIAYSQKRRDLLLCALGVFLTAFAVRIIFAVFALKNNAVLYPDSYDYINLADFLCRNFSYGFNSQEIFRVPVYPLFLSLIKLFFPSSFIPISIFTQSILDTLTATMFFLLAFRLFKSLAFATIAGLFYALSPLAISSSAQILSETLFAFLLVILLLALARILKEKPSLVICLVVGLLMAILTLTRVVFFPFSMIILLFILLRSKSLKAVLLTGAICYIILFGWGLRNYLVSKYFGISSVSSINTYRYNACALESKITGEPFSQMQKEFDSRLSALKTQKEQAEYASREGWRIILEHPLEYVVIHLRISLNTLLLSPGDFTRAFGLQLGDKGTLAVINSKGMIEGIKFYFKGNIGLFLVLLPLTILLCIQYLLSILGAIKALKFRKDEFLFVSLLVLCALYFIFVGGPASTPRFRIPAEGIIFIFASYGLYAIYDFLLRRRNDK